MSEEKQTMPASMIEPKYFFKQSLVAENFEELHQTTTSGRKTSILNLLT